MRCKFSIPGPAVLPADEFARWSIDPRNGWYEGAQPRTGREGNWISTWRGAGPPSLRRRSGGRRSRARLDSGPRLCTRSHPVARAGAGQSRSTRAGRRRRGARSRRWIRCSWRFASAHSSSILGTASCRRSPIAHVEQMLARVRREIECIASSPLLVRPDRATPSWRAERSHVNLSGSKHSM